MSRATIDDLLQAERIVLCGVTGSGKSTTAKALGDALGLPVHLVDEEIGWLPGWVLRSNAEQLRIAREIASGDSWVIDSTYAGFQQAVLGRAQVVVGLDYPRWFSLQRLVRRTLLEVLTRRSTCNGNVNTLGKILSRDSIIVWHFRKFDQKRRRMRAWEADPTGPRVIRLTRQREADGLLRELRARCEQELEAAQTSPRS